MHHQGRPYINRWVITWSARLYTSPSTGLDTTWCLIHVSHAKENNMLKSITIQKFKGIHEIDLQLGEINVLVGGNNAGKSSVLQAIQFAVSIAQTTSTQKQSKERRLASVSEI